jgi:hypothetical protein
MPKKKQIKYRRNKLCQRKNYKHDHGINYADVM